LTNIARTTRNRVLKRELSKKYVSLQFCMLMVFVKTITIMIMMMMMMTINCFYINSYNPRHKLKFFFLG